MIVNALSRGYERYINKGIIIIIFMIFFPEN